MNVFVKGVAFRNKGAHLMLQAVREETARWPVPVVLAMNPTKGTRRQRREAGIVDHARVENSRILALGRTTGAVGNLLPASLRRSIGFMADKEVQGVLDASGFSYSDQWGPATVELMVSNCRSWRRRGVPIIMLPQAFGPFTTERIRRAFRELVDLVDLVHVRDDSSASHIRDLNVPEEKLRQAPDFTCLLPGRTRPSDQRLFGRPCFIPNYRMVDKTARGIADGYIDFLERCARKAFEAGTEPFVLIHDQGRDRELVSQLESRLGRPLETVVEDDPLLIKGLVGQVSFVVGSRFHGLISALTQGVPCIGTSWSHKYDELFRSFGCESLLVPGTGLGDPAASDTMMAVMLDPAERRRWSETTAAVASDHVARTRRMWLEVREVLGIPASIRKASADPAVAGESLT